MTADARTAWYRSLASPAYRHTGQPGLVSRSAAL
jgi:hypothetical protein